IVCLSHTSNVRSCCSSRVDQPLTITGSKSDRYILQCSAKPSHGMALEVREYNDSTIVLQMTAYNEFLQMVAILHREGDLTHTVQDVAGSDLCVTMIFQYLQMGLSLITGTLISDITFPDCSMDMIKQ